MVKLKPEEQQFIDELYETQYRMLFNYARSILRDEDTSKEVVQDTFLLACRKINSIMNSPNPHGWLVKAVDYTIQRVNRKKKQIAQYIAQLPDDFDFDNIIDERSPDEDVGILYTDLSKHKDFELLKEFAVDGKPIKKIAEKRNISIDACTKRLSRVKKLFRDTINKNKE